MKGAIFVESLCCPWCKEELQNTGLEKTIQMTQFKVQVCASCGIAVTSPRPTPESISALYFSSDSTLERSSSPDFQHDRGIFRRLKHKLAKGELKRRVIGRRKVESLLDLGCGDGTYSNAAKSILGGEAEVVASDFHENRPPGLSREVMYLSNTDLANRKFEVILLRHVLEHTDDPIKFLEQLKDKLEIDGKIYIEVPNFESTLRMWFGSKWELLYLPRHLWHFNAHSLSNVLFRAGLTGKVHRCETPYAGSQMATLFGRYQYGIGWRLLGIVLHPIQVLIEKLSGSSSCLFVLASRSTTN